MDILTEKRGWICKRAACNMLTPNSMKEKKKVLTLSLTGRRGTNNEYSLRRYKEKKINNRKWSCSVAGNPR